MYKKIKGILKLGGKKCADRNQARQTSHDSVENVQIFEKNESSESPSTSTQRARSAEISESQTECTLGQFSTVAEVHVTVNQTGSGLSTRAAFDRSESVLMHPPPTTSDFIPHRQQPSSYARISVGPQPVKQNESSENIVFERLAEIYHQFPTLRTEVRILMANEAVVYLLGTNHADPQCPEDVENIIKKVSPQTVVIELCAWRACGCEVHRGNVFQTKPEFTFRYLRRVISQIGFLPAMIFFTDAFNEYNAITDQLLDYGGEFAVAARLCEEMSGCKIILGDREIPITVKRQASGMGNWRSIRVSVLVTLALIFKRRMKPLLLRGHRLVIKDPRFYQIVVLERDIFLTYMIQVAAGLKSTAEKPQIVAVVGQGHLNGIQHFWGKVLPQILPLVLKPDIEF